MIAHRAKLHAWIELEVERVIRLERRQTQCGQAPMQRRSSRAVPACVELEHMRTLGNCISTCATRAHPVPNIHPAESLLAKKPLMANVRSAHVISRGPRHGGDVGNCSGGPLLCTDVWVSTRGPGNMHSAALLEDS